MRTIQAFAIIALACTVVSGRGESPAQTQTAGKARTFVILVDYSKSIEDLEDTTQALTCHLLKLAELSGEPVAFVVIFFGGDGVQVFPGKGEPTTAHKALHHELVKHWPKPSGGTPLDAAMQEAMRIVGTLPRGSDVSVILFTDGEPSSGYLRPEAFPEVKAEIDRQIKLIQNNPKGYPPAIVQQLLNRLEKETQDPRTELCKKLYAIQLKAEFKKTIDHAQALKQSKARFLSVDYAVGIPALKQIHDAAGGQPNDLVIAKPATVISQMHKLGLTTLPHVVVQDPVTISADAKLFERSTSLKLDPLGDRALVTVVFEPPVADFGKHLELAATYEGNAHPFTPANDDPSRILSFDSSGKVATAHLVLDHLPADRQLALTLKSPGLSMSMPACTVYLHLRLGKDILPQFRPHHAPTEASGPFKVSPNQEARWIAAYRSKDNPKPYPVKSIEAVLRNTQTGATVRLDTKPDAQVAYTFGSEALRLPRGIYDVTLQTILESGAGMTTLLPRHIEVQQTDEYIALEITPNAGKGAEHFSFQPGHVDFGELGDHRLTGKVAIVLRSMGVPYDIPVEISVEGLMDSQGKSPKDAWIVPDRKKMFLKPGRAERLLLHLKVPEEIEGELVDGLFKGQLNVLRKDLGVSMPVKRFQSIVGVPDDEPPDLVAFTLRRPTLKVRAPRCLGDTLHATKENKLILPIHVAIARPFARTATLTVSHTSTVTRQVTVLPEATFRDSQGRQVPFVRLMPENSALLSRDIPAGSSTTWTFRFEADELYDLSKATGKIVVSGPGLPSLYITVEVLPRMPLLGVTWQLILWILAGLLLLLLLVAAVRFLRARAFREQKEIAVTEEKALPGYLTLKVTGKNQVTLQPQQAVFYRFGDEPRKPLAENRPLTLGSDSLSGGKALIIEEQKPDGEEGWSLSFSELFLDPPELRGEILAAPAHAATAAHYRRQMRRRFLFAASLLLLATTFFSPVVVRAAQWLYDAIPW